jgi:beta-phosphoglucomutase-like phosphatase (HAD superfamily)
MEFHTSGFKLLLASSSPHIEIDTVLEKFKLVDYFSTRVSGTELPQSKPHPGIFIKAADLIKVAPSHCLVIEDAENGVIAAKAAGMKCTGFSNPNSGKQNLGMADKIISSFKELTVGLIRTL